MLTIEETDTVKNIWRDIERDVAHMCSLQEVMDTSLREAQRNRKGHGSGLAYAVMIQSICEGVCHKKIPRGHLASRAMDSLLALQVGCGIGRYTDDARSVRQEDGAKIRRRYRRYQREVGDIISANIARVVV
jgi:hypothetical protein